MNKTPDYWRAIESTYGMKAASCTWDKYLGGEKTRLSRHIRPTGRLVNMYPCPNEFGCGFDHEIRIWRETDIAAVPVDDEYDRCRVYKLKHEDIVEYEMDADSVLHETFRLLDIRPGELRPTDFFETYAIGTSSRKKGTAMQVYLTIPEERKQFCQAATGLLAVGETPFVFISLTPKFMDTVAMEGLARHKCPFLIMEEMVAVGDHGELALLCGMDDALRSQYAPDEAPSPENVFRLDGAAWTMSYAGETIHLPDTKGFRYVALLLGSPDKAWRIEDLYLSAGNGAPVPARQNLAGQENRLHVTGPSLESGVEVIDAQSRQEYKNRLQKIEEEMDDVRYVGNTERLGALELERDGIVEELARAVGYRGRTRKMGAGAERLRIAITKNIGRAIEVILARHPALGRHLDNSLQTGYTVAYRPESTIDWQT